MVKTNKLKKYKNKRRTTSNKHNKGMKGGKLQINPTDLQNLHLYLIWIYF